MEWGSGGGNAGAGLLCRRLRHAARAPPLIQALSSGTPRYVEHSALPAFLAGRPATHQSPRAPAMPNYVGFFITSVCVNS